MVAKKYRQGDVLFIQMESLPNCNARKRENGHILEGEVTGHVHRIEDLSSAEVLEIGAGLFVKVNERGVSIVHDEHNPISLPPGAYEVRQQREYSPQKSRFVTD